jgi:hypothetical protein
VTPDRIPTSVAIIGGDAVVGQALELLLGSADFSARFLFEPSLDEPGWLDGIKLLLLAPGLDSERRKALLELIDSRPLGSRILVLELIDSARAAQVGEGHFVPWPCRAEELKRQVTAALLGRSDASQDDHEDKHEAGQDRQVLQASQ